MNDSYKFGGGDERKAFGPLPPGDYNFAVAECPEPYQKDNGNWVLNVRLSILPGGETVFAPVWSGTDKNGDDRDGIGSFLVAVNRAPKVGQEPNWAKVVGARGKCRLKVEIAQQGALAGKEVNKVHYFYEPKQIGPGTQPEQPPTYSKPEVKKAASTAQAAAVPSDVEPDDIPF